MSVQAAISAFVKAFRTTDDQILDDGIDCGSTACVAVFGQAAFICANTGDSRAILCAKATTAPTSHVADAAPAESEGGEAKSADGAGAIASATNGDEGARVRVTRLTTDHKPALPSERERIEAAGGLVLTLGGVPRVCSEKSPCMLAVSRALGDRSLKFGGTTPRGLITDHPECSYQSYSGNELLVVLMSDGVSDVLEDTMIADIALTAALTVGAPTAEAAADAAAAAVVNAAADRYSPDDITAVVVLLSDEAWKPSARPGAEAM
mmetsp:Transcript_35719/g.93360  ORF Transcript_35719/g.93360 Transcript_35719/m.93360 type:complete len:265 (+) Transcript_35719:225-1019(+)